MLSGLGNHHVRFYGSLVVLLLSLTSLLLFFPESFPVVKHLGNVKAYGGDGILNRETALQHDPPPRQPPYGALVIASQAETDLSWTQYAREECVSKLKPINTQTSI